MTKIKEKDQKTTALSEIKCILIQNGQTLKSIDLDEVNDLAQITAMYLSAVAKYGTVNVRYCKIVSANLKQEVEFIE
jgi:hypothetical protein